MLRRVRQGIGKMVEDTFAELHNVMLSAARLEMLDAVISKDRPEVKGVVGRCAGVRVAPVRGLRRAALCGLGRRRGSSRSAVGCLRRTRRVRSGCAVHRVGRGARVSKVAVVVSTPT